MNIEINEVNEYNKWDERLREYNGSLFLGKKFLESIADNDSKSVFFEFTRNHETIALLSGIIRPLTKSVEKQLFFYSGIACKVKDDKTLADCKNILINNARQNSYARVIFESYDELSYRKIVSKHLISGRDRAEFVIPLNDDKEKILKGFNPNVRRMARRAMQNGAVLKYGYSSFLLDKLYDLLQQTHEERTAKGYGNYHISALPFLDYEKLLKLLNDGLAQICYVELEQEILCMQYNLVIGNLVYGLLMGTNKKGYKLGAPSMLFYEVIQDYKSKGFIRYNLGGIPMDKKHEGIKKFKLSMGAKIVESSQEQTLFLYSPLSRLNPILTCKQFFTNIKIPWIIKKQLLKLLEYLLKGKDRY